MKTFVLTVSRQFPKTHKRAGEETYFPVEILNKNKKHTIRCNYELWKKRIDQVNEGKAILSLRYWTGSPYNYQRDGSKQGVFLQLSKGECGIQKLTHYSNDLCYPIVDDNTDSNNVWPNIHKNDGLTYDDFKDWFKNYDLSKPMAIIHFTKFRY